MGLFNLSDTHIVTVELRRWIVNAQPGVWVGMGIQPG